MGVEVPDNAEVRAVTDQRGNVCGYLFGRQELPHALIKMIDQETPTTGYHGVNYHIRKVD